MKKILRIFLNKTTQENGSITLFVLLSMLFFLIVLLGIYANTSLKVQNQKKEIDKIQSTYNQMDINSAYYKAYEKYMNN